MTRSIILALVACGTTTLAAAQPVPMHEDPRIRQGFHDFYTAREIDDNCDALGLRRLAALAFYNSMVSYARGAGYTRADFKALEDDDAVKDAFKAELRADLAARGATPGNDAGFCAAGREEIAAGTQIGKLLKGE